MIEINSKFGKYTVLECSHVSKNGHRKYLCRCDCGKEKIVFGSNLIRGHSTSCGCAKIKHGLEKTRVYSAWREMMRRCYNTKSNTYERYGNRGITVCDEWHDINNFLKDMGQPQKGQSIDRIDNDKGYSKENCRWATSREQARNRRSNRLIEYKGKIKPLIEWAEIYQIDYQLLWQRITKLKWDIEKALNQPVRKMKKPGSDEEVTHDEEN